MKLFWACLVMAVVGAIIGVALAMAEDIDFNLYVDAIYKAEGGAKAQYLYGIRSIKYDTPEEARKICYNSVKNNYKRWEKAGREGDFVEFMSRRYCPIGAKNDPKGVNKNWVKNVKYFL